MLMGNEQDAAPLEKREDSSSRAPEDHPPFPRNTDSMEITEETPPGQSQPRAQQGLVVAIPPRTVDAMRDDCVRINVPSTTQSPNQKRMNFPSRSNLKALLPRLSFKYRNRTSEIERAARMALGCTSGETPRSSRAWSFTRVFTPRLNKTSSLPATPIAHSNPESTHGGNANDLLASSRQKPQKSIHRSHSVPVFNDEDGSVRPSDSVRGVFRVIASTPRGTEDSVKSKLYTSPKHETDVDDGDDEHIAEEEAVCRICWGELGEGSDTFKLECLCKGELALGHQECVMKWFTIKGNRTCDVCKQDVQNLPVTLQRVQNGPGRSRAFQGVASQYSVWQDVPILVIVSMLAYFCFLEQLLVMKMKSGAIAISLPFSCILGLLASMTSTTMVRKRYVWTYAAVQFALVVICAQLFYRLLHMQAVLAVLFATLAGFGAMMIGTSIVSEILKWRRSLATPSNDTRNQSQSPNSNPSPNPQAVPSDQSRTNDENRGVEMRDSESLG